MRAKTLDRSAGDRLALRELIDAYHAAVNMRDLDQLAALFTADAIWEAMPPVGLRFEGRAAIRDGLRGTIGKQEMLVQSSSGVHIETLGDDEALIRSTMIELGREVEGGRGWCAVAFYLDRAVRDEEPRAWRFARRTLHLRYMQQLSVAGEVFAVPPPRQAIRE
ncbi:MAG: nuclear transport factor 2 family protein [Gemmatimonadaceae bacterium]